MRILITGDRHWRCDELAEQVLNRLLGRYGPETVIVHGGAPGVDQSFALACRELGITAEPHLADWKGLGNVTGPARNREMVQAGADLCVALHRTLETSRGTKDCIRQALAAGIPVYLIEDEQAIPRRVHAEDERLSARRPAGMTVGNADDHAVKRNRREDPLTSVPPAYWTTVTVKFVVFFSVTIGTPGPPLVAVLFLGWDRIWQGEQP